MRNWLHLITTAICPSSLAGNGARFTIHRYKQMPKYVPKALCRISSTSNQPSRNSNWHSSMNSESRKPASRMRTVCGRFVAPQSKKPNGINRTRFCTTPTRLKDIHTGMHIADANDLIYIHVVITANLCKFIRKGNIYRTEGILYNLGHLRCTNIGQNNFAKAERSVYFFISRILMVAKISFRSSGRDILLMYIRSIFSLSRGSVL